MLLSAAQRTHRAVQRGFVALAPQPSPCVAEAREAVDGDPGGAAAGVGGASAPPGARRALAARGLRQRRRPRSRPRAPALPQIRVPVEAGDAWGEGRAVDGGAVVGAPGVRVPQLPLHFIGKASHEKVNSSSTEGSKDSRVRTSSGMFLRRGQDKIISTIEKRIAEESQDALCDDGHLSSVWHKPKGAEEGADGRRHETKQCTVPDCNGTLSLSGYLLRDL